MGVRKRLERGEAVIVTRVKLKTLRAWTQERGGVASGTLAYEELFNSLEKLIDLLTFALNHRTFCPLADAMLDQVLKDLGDKP